VTSKDDLFDQVKSLSAEDKILLFEDLGMKRIRHSHRWGCASVVDAAFVCNCVPPESVWSQPGDLQVHFGETREERVAYGTARRMYDTGDGPPPSERWGMH
jgi:hypothetical protein